MSVLRGVGLLCPLPSTVMQVEKCPWRLNSSFLGPAFHFHDYVYIYNIYTVCLYIYKITCSFWLPANEMSCCWSNQGWSKKHHCGKLMMLFEFCGVSNMTLPGQQKLLTFRGETSTIAVDYPLAIWHICRNCRNGSSTMYICCVFLVFSKILSVIRPTVCTTFFCGWKMIEFWKEPWLINWSMFLMSCWFYEILMKLI